MSETNLLRRAFLAWPLAAVSAAPQEPTTRDAKAGPTASPHAPQDLAADLRHRSHLEHEPLSLRVGRVIKPDGRALTARRKHLKLNRRPEPPVTPEASSPTSESASRCRAFELTACVRLTKLRFSLTTTSCLSGILDAPPAPLPSCRWRASRDQVAHLPIPDTQRASGWINSLR